MRSLLHQFALLRRDDEGLGGLPYKIPLAGSINIEIGKKTSHHSSINFNVVMNRATFDSYFEDYLQGETYLRPTTVRSI